MRYKSPIPAFSADIVHRPDGQLLQELPGRTVGANMHRAGRFVGKGEEVVREHKIIVPEVQVDALGKGIAGHAEGYPVRSLCGRNPQVRLFPVEVLGRHKGLHPACQEISIGVKQIHCHKITVRIHFRQFQCKYVTGRQPVHGYLHPLLIVGGEVTASDGQDDAPPESPHGLIGHIHRKRSFFQEETHGDRGVKPPGSVVQRLVPAEIVHAGPGSHRPAVVELPVNGAHAVAPQTAEMLHAVADGVRLQQLGGVDQILKAAGIEIAVGKVAEDRETVIRLREAGVLTAVASSSKNARLILTQVGLIDLFDAIIDGTQITKSKPNPEVFLKAAELLHKKPQDCIVVEDADAGIAAAKSAGMYAVAVGNAHGGDLHYSGLNSVDLLKLAVGKETK